MESNLIAKIALGIATAEDFSFLFNDFVKSLALFSRPNVERTLLSFGFKVTIRGTYIEIVQGTPPNYTCYNISYYSMHFRIQHNVTTLYDSHGSV